MSSRAMRKGSVRVVVVLLLVFGAACGRDRQGLDSSPESGPERGPETGRVAISSIAVRVHRLEAMVAFYGEAFGCRFREVETFGVVSRFTEIGGLTLKFVPIRSETDFVGYPSHQPGFEVPDVERVIELALKHGGRREGEIHRRDDGIHASVRDPDGNTIELYSRSP